MILTGPVKYVIGMSYLSDDWTLKEHFRRKILKKDFTYKFTR